MKFFLTFIAVFFIYNSYSANLSDLDKRCNVTDSFYYTSNFQDFLKNYDDLSKDSIFIKYYKRYYDKKHINAIIATKKYDSFYNLIYSDSTNIGIDYNQIAALYYFDSLPNDNRKKALMDSANMEFLREYPNANMKLVRILYDIKDRDQYIRGNAANLLYTTVNDKITTTNDTVLRNRLWNWQTNLDSINARWIDTLFLRYGYPQQKDGDFLVNVPVQVIQHLNKNRMIAYYDIIYSEYLKGNIYKDNFARYYDRFYEYINCNQYYGTQKTKGKDNKFYIDKTDDIESINERRIRMELDPLTNEEISQLQQK